MPSWDFEVHREPLYKRYYAGHFSTTFLFSIILGGTLVLLPLFISYSAGGTPMNNGGFWLKEKTKYQQPHVAYRQQAIIQVNGRTTGTDTPFNLHYSTSNTLNQMSSDTRMAVVQSATFDENGDGVTDRFEFTVTMPLKETEEVLGFDAIFMHDVQIKHRTKVTFDAASFVQFQGGDAAISSLHMGGDFLVQQDKACPATSQFKVPYPSALIPKVFEHGIDYSQYTLSKVMQEASHRTMSMRYTSTYETATRVLAPQPQGHGMHMFNATIVMRVPEQPVLVQPAIAEVLKVSWVQFMPFIIILGYCTYFLMGYLLSTKLVSSGVLADVVTEKME